MSTVYSKASLREMSEQLSEDVEDDTVIYRQRNRAVVRLVDEVHGTVVVKLYTVSGCRGFGQRLLGTGSGDYESRGLVALAQIGVRVPRLLGRLRLKRNGLGFTDGLVMEDLGDGMTGAEYLRGLVRDEQVGARLVFEEYLLNMAATIVANGLVDTDPGIVNSLVRADGTFCRLDVEMVRRVRNRRLASKDYGKMFGRLLGSYAMAVGVEGGVFEDFALRFCEAMHPSAQSWRFTGLVMADDLARRYRNGGEVAGGIVLPDLDGVGGMRLGGDLEGYGAGVGAAAAG